MADAPLPRCVRGLGKLLPASRRRLMFEPICAELWHDRVAGGRGAMPLARFWGRLAGTFVSTFALSWPRYFHDDGRLTRFGRTTLVFAGAATLLVALSLADWVLWLLQREL